MKLVRVTFNWAVTVLEQLSAANLSGALSFRTLDQQGTEAQLIIIFTMQSCAFELLWVHRLAAVSLETC